MPIVTMPKDATLQFGDQFANINHQGVLTSNINNTPILGPTFPTTNTGDSLCHAHYTESSTNALQFLNASGSGLGGHKFYTSNSTDAPLNTATIDVNGLTVDRSITGVTQITNVGNAISIERNSGYCSLYDNSLFFEDFVNNRQSFMRTYDSEYQDNINNTSTIIGFPTSGTNRVFYSRGKTSNIEINVDIPTITLTDDTLGTNVILNTELLKNNTQKTLLNFSNNSLSLTSANNQINNFMEPTQTILRDNANNLQNYINPSRMIVNDGNLDTSSIINAGLLQIGNPTDISTISPLIIEIKKRNGSNSMKIENNSILMENNTNGLNIILDTASLRNNTQKTVLDLLANQLNFSSSTNFFTSELKPESIFFNDTLNNLNLFCSGENVALLNTDAVLNTNLYAGIIQIGDYNNDKQQYSTSEYVELKNNLGTINSKLTKENLTITDISSNVSVLSSTDLKFNNVSLKSQVATNTSNINNILINSAQIPINTANISKLQYASPINIANSPIIYGTLPSSPPMIPTTNAINTGFNGWYYKNISTAYNNISWSTGFQPSSYVVSNLKGFYFTFVSLTTTSKPFVSIYTLPAQAPGGFYNSRRSYVPAIAPAVITAGVPYIYYFMFDTAYPTPFKYCHQAVALSLSGVNPVGAFGPNELLYFMSINTNSISPINTEELIVGESGVIIDDGTGTLIQPFSFNSSDVYSPNSLRAVQQNTTLTPTISNNSQIYIATGNFTIVNTGLSGVPAGFFIIVQGGTTDRVITYNTSLTKTVHTNTGAMNAGQVIFYWTGTQFTAYN